MGCEGVDVGPDERMIGGVWRKNGGERYDDDARGRVKRPAPPRSPSVGDNSTAGTARLVSMYASVW